MTGREEFKRQNDGIYNCRIGQVGKLGTDLFDRFEQPFFVGWSCQCAVRSGPRRQQPFQSEGSFAVLAVPAVSGGEKGFEPFRETTQVMLNPK